MILGFIAPLRPVGWAETLDFDSLRKHPAEYVADNLQRRLGDVVWSIARRGGGREQTIHLLIEHQSAVDYSMALRFLNYSSLHYQQRYRDRRWRKGDTAGPVLHVVLYNGGTRWDAAQSLAEMVPRWEDEGAAQIALSYEVVDLVGMAADELPRPNLISWVADMERSRSAGELAARVRELGQWLAAEGEAELTKSFDLWLGALGRKWDVELPSIRDYEEASAMLLEKIDRWEAEIREQGIQRGIERGIEQGIKRGIEQGIQEGRLEGQQEGEMKGRLETIEGLLQAGIGWEVIHSATGIDEQTYRALKRDSANGTEPVTPH